MGTILYFCDLRPSPRTPWGPMDPRLRTYVYDQMFQTRGPGHHKNLNIRVEFVSLQTVAARRNIFSSFCSLQASTY